MANAKQCCCCLLRPRPAARTRAAVAPGAIAAYGVGAKGHAGVAVGEAEWYAAASGGPVWKGVVYSGGSGWWWQRERLGARRWRCCAATGAPRSVRDMSMF